MTPHVDHDELARFGDAAQTRAYLRQTRNWGRWGTDDQRGTLNHITQDTRVRAAALVRSGISVSLSRPVMTRPAPENPYPAQLHLSTNDRGDGAGSAREYFGISCHGTATTHIDAIGHVWDVDGEFYNGVPASSAVGYNGLTWCGLEQFSSGVFTRGVLLDVTAARGEPFVTMESPVTGRELEWIADEMSADLQPGDAVVVYCGRERWDEQNAVWGSAPQRPGLDVSCVQFLREHDCSVLVWDMTDSKPLGPGLSHGVHAAIPNYGLVLVDSASLQDLVTVCAQQNRIDFLLTVNPLVLPGGTGCAVNPIAVL